MFNCCTAPSSSEVKIVTTLVRGGEDGFSRILTKLKVSAEPSMKMYTDCSGQEQREQYNIQVRHERYKKEK